MRNRPSNKRRARLQPDGLDPALHRRLAFIYLCKECDEKYGEALGPVAGHKVCPTCGQVVVRGDAVIVISNRRLVVYKRGPSGKDTRARWVAVREWTRVNGRRQRLVAHGLTKASAIAKLSKRAASAEHARGEA